MSVVKTIGKVIVVLMATCFLIGVIGVACEESQKQQADKPQSTAASDNQQQPQTQEQKQEANKEYKAESNPQPEKKPAQPEQSSYQGSEQGAFDAAVEYYSASSAGNFGYTYGHLTSEAKQRYTLDEWYAINDALDSAGAQYNIQQAYTESQGTYHVDVLVGTETRATTFVYDNGQYYHAPTSEEYSLYDGATESATASASASASAAASAGAQPTAGRDTAKVVISANKPVDVSIISVKDGQVPMITEETSSKTYSFGLKPGADLQVAATDPDMDFNANDDISIKVYINGELKSQDTDDIAAMVEF